MLREGTKGIVKGSDGAVSSWGETQKTPKEAVKKNIEEDLREMNLRETDGVDQDDCRTAIKSSNSLVLRRTGLMGKVKK